MRTEKETVKGTLYVWAIPRTESAIMASEDKRTFSYEIGQSHHWRDSAVRVCDFAVVADIPEGIDLLEKAVTTMKASIERIQTEAREKVNRLEEQIRNLMLIEYKPGGQ